MKTATVKDLIDCLKKLPQDLPCYVRPKYNGAVEAWESIPIKISGVSEMHPLNDDLPKNVTFLI